jgi:protein ImuB
MVCRLDLSIHPPLTLNIGLFAPTIDADHLSGLIINQLESKELPACVDRLTISVTHTGPLRTVQQSLFDVDRSHSIMSGSDISRLVDSLSCRLGRDSVLGVQLEDDPLPENAFSVQPLAGNSISSRNIRPFNSVRNSIRSPFHDESPPPSTLSSPNFSIPLCKQSHSPSPDDALRRPLCLLLDPLPLEVSLDTSSFFQFLPSPQLPKCVRIGGVIHRIVMHWGPERIETGWWKGPCTRRDYYRIETDSGRWWWIFRNLVSKSQTADTPHYHWMLHGRF